MKEHEPAFTLEPILIGDLDWLIKRTPTYNKYIDSSAFMLNDVIYRVEFCWAPRGLGKFHVDIYDTENCIELGEYHTLWKSKTPEAIIHNNIITLAKLIHRQIMDEVKDIIKNMDKLK